MKTSAFPKILHIGNKQISDLFDGVVEITEKVDGSQLGFGKVNGEWLSKPKHNVLAYDRTPKNGIALFGVYNPETQEHYGMDKLEVAISQYKSEARWNKAIQHLRENGELAGTPADIGRLIKEVRFDITLEEKENIKEELWKIYKDDFLRNAVFGLPEWYKKKLATGDVDVETVKENGQGI